MVSSLDNWVVSKSTRAILAFLVSFLSCGLPGFAQSNSGAVKGSVLDPSGAVISNATVMIANPVSQYTRTTQTDSQGNFDFTNIPFNNYHVSIAAPGFQSSEQDVNVRSSVPSGLQGHADPWRDQDRSDGVGGRDLVETDSTSHTDVDRALFDKLPLESNSSSLSSLVTLATPGISADSNGLFHGFGDHASNSFSVDGQPITDQQSKVFSNQIPLDSVQSMEVIAGAPPAEFGGKTSVVIVANYALGSGRHAAARRRDDDLRQLRDRRRRHSISPGAARSGATLSRPTASIPLDFWTGRSIPCFTIRATRQMCSTGSILSLPTADSINLNLGFSRSWFQTPNSWDSQNATAWSGLGGR